MTGDFRRESMNLSGVFQFIASPKLDERGEYIRHFSKNDIVEFGVRNQVTQANLVRTTKALTFRGMHFQVGPHAETKLLSCLTGEIVSVLTDLRPKSLTYLQSISIPLFGGSNRLLLIPKGVANGYLTTTDGAVVHYYSSTAYSPKNEYGFRFDDPLAAIQLPWSPLVVSKKDKSWPPLKVTLSERDQVQDEWF